MNANGEPTDKQLKYLKTLAVRAGETFVYPTTRWEASDAIERLLGRKRSPEFEVREDRDATRHGVQSGGLMVAYRADEVTGYGSSARWRGR